MTDRPLTVRDLNRALLARQHLLARTEATPIDVLAQTCGLQAQLARPPFVGLWTRIDGFERDDLAQLFTKRRAVRATMFRGTIHVVTAKDYLAMRPLLQPLLTSSIHAILRERAKGLDLGAIARQARAYLKSGPRTFEDIRDALVKLHPKGDARAIGLAVRCILPLVMAPHVEDGEAHPWSFTGASKFGLAEAWLNKPVRDHGTDEDLKTLVLRYLAAFGPATPGDMQKWCGIQALAPTFEALRPKLVVVRDERKRELFDLPEAPRPEGDVDAPPRFLPEYDNVLLAYADRTRITALEDKSKVFLPGLAVAATFTIDGFVRGTWKIARAKGKATLAVAPFEPIANKAKDALVTEAESLVRFVEPDAASFEVVIAK